MHRRLSEVVDRVSSHFFPGLNAEWSPEESTAGSEIVSNLHLQVCLYFNVWLFPCWFATSLVCLTVKFEHLTIIFQPLALAIVVAVTILEVIRVYLGYSGNLAEKIPELVGFWLLTLLIQLPLLGFALISPGLKTLVFERTINAILLTFVALELIFGYVAIQTIAREQMKRFHISQKREIDKEKDL